MPPSVVSTFPNGSPPAALLRDVGDGGGAMLILPSMGRQALGIAYMAAHPGRRLYTVGRGRSVQQQYNMLHGRYSMERPPDFRGDTNYVLAHWWGGKFWPEGWWYQVVGAMVAVPGTSNHGDYVADDICELDPITGAVISLSDIGLTWLRDNGPRFGFGLETRKERWHWHWIAGDVLPQAVIDVLTFVGIPIVGHPLPPQVPTVPVEPTQPPVVIPVPTLESIAVNLQKTTLRPELRAQLKGHQDVLLVQFVALGLYALTGNETFNVGKPDGDYGDRTQAAVKLMQQLNGLVVDAVCGPVTWHAVLNGDGK